MSWMWIAFAAVYGIIAGIAIGAEVRNRQWKNLLRRYGILVG